MKKKILYISIVVISFLQFGSTVLNAQVVVGKKVSPEEYSLLQIEYDDTKYPNGGGVQLPRISESERTALQNKVSADPNSVGLTIFNTTTLRAEYWNGREWVAIPGIIQPEFTANNGLHDTPDAETKTLTVKLGGTLSKPTNIALNEKTLTIDQEANTKLEIGSLSVMNNNVGVGVSDSPTARLHVERKSDQQHGLRIADGSEDINKVLTALDNTGKAKWQDLKEVISLSKGAITTASNYSIAYTGTTVNYTKVSTTPVKCTPGKWIIIGRFMSEYSSSEGNYKYYYSWGKLQTTDGTVLSIAGVKAEPGGLGYSIPQVVYFGYFDRTTEIDLYGAAPDKKWNTNSRLGDYGGRGFLYAIQLSE